jgi:predicted TIM-barrel fold metal-dependent hydrolase
MDDAGIDVAITSISTPGVLMGDDSAARDLARRVNELSAELIQERPDRFGGFAAIAVGSAVVGFVVSAFLVRTGLRHPSTVE